MGPPRARQFGGLPQREPPSGTGRLWAIVGGEGTPGILVRNGKALESTELRERLAPGAQVEELELEGTRLHFRLVSGKGPDQGWISTKSKTRILAERVEEPPEPAGAITGFMPGDAVQVWSVSKGHWADDGVVQEVAAQDEVTQEGRLPRGSVLVAYDGGAGVKWVAPAEQAQVLRKMQTFLPGDKVHVWSVNGNAWAEDGIVQDVALEDLFIEGQEIGRNSVFVVYNGGAGMKWLGPSEQQERLRLQLPAPGWLTQGDAVHVWSVNGGKWYEDGVVQEVASENLVSSDQEVARGAVFVTYNGGAGMKWVMPWEQQHLLRGGEVPPPGEESEAMAAFAAGQGPEGPAEMEGQLQEGGPPEAACPQAEPTEEEDLEIMGEIYVAIDDWEPPEDARSPALPLLAGSVVMVLQADEGDGWHFGKNNQGMKGWLPAAFVRPEGEVCLGESSSEEAQEDQQERAAAPPAPAGTGTSPEPEPQTGPSEPPCREELE
mmetsp:Transcript_104194/g.336043  ORF Transcript_104194/g.336043 Transcript_104194/m.336043 type:complete len:490 (-) Transcript_104194:79-1548(-)